MLASYSPKNVKVALSFEGTSRAITGFSPDSFIRLKRNTSVVSEYSGLSGELAVSNVKDKTGIIEIQLMQTARSNLLLADLVGFLESEGRVGYLTLTILDPSGSVIVESVDSYFKQVPSIGIGVEQSSKTWVFGCKELVFTGQPAGYTGDDAPITFI